MNFYITTGTVGFMKKYLLENPTKELFFLFDGKEVGLMQESLGTSVFRSPRSYQVLQSYGQFSQEGFLSILFTEIDPIHQPIFEKDYPNVLDKLVSQKGFRAYRFIKPLKRGNQYALVTYWENKRAFKNWSETAHFQQVHDFPLQSTVYADFFVAKSFSHNYWLPLTYQQIEEFFNPPPQVQNKQEENPKSN